MESTVTPRALVVDPNPASCLALAHVLERRGFAAECCLGPSSRCGPCPLLETGHCPLVSESSGPSSLAVIVLPKDAAFTTELVDAYRGLYTAVVVLDDSTDPIPSGLAAGLEPLSLLRAEADEMASWLRGVSVAVASALCGGDTSRVTRVVWTAQEILRRLEPDTAAHPVTEFALLLRDIGSMAPVLGPGVSALGSPQHAVRGAEIVASIAPLRDAIPIVRHHHERWDGTGSPDRLVGKQIPAACRAIAVAEAFDEIALGGPHWEERALRATEDLRAARGSAFDPDAVEILLDLVESGTFTPPAV